MNIYSFLQIIVIFRVDMVNHMAIEHGSDAPTVYEAICKTRFLQCPKCEEKFHHHYYLRRHARINHGSMEGLEFRCDVSVDNFELLL